MGRKKLEDQVRAVAAFAEAGSDMCSEDEQDHAKALFEGANWLLANAKVVAHAPELLNALVALMKDYDEQYSVLTDGQYGRTPATPEWKAARRLVTKLK